MSSMKTLHPVMNVLIVPGNAGMTNSEAVQL